jgi:DNA repair protein RadC
MPATQLDLLDHSTAMSPIAMLEAARAYLTRPQRDVLSSWDALLAYVHLKHGNPRREEFRVLFLDRKNCLLDDHLMGVGTVDHVPAYPREIMRQAILCDASALILIHNHPSGDPTPSESDIAMTKQVVKVGALLGITVHDHVIVGAGRDISMRAAGLM